MSGLFFAVFPDYPAKARIHCLAKAVKCAHRFDGKLTEPDRLHATLFFLGDSALDRIVRMACETARELRMPPFDVSFDRIASFRGGVKGHPFVLLGDDGLIRLKQFRQALGAAMTRNGLRRMATTDFNPHVTLLYDRRNVEEHPIEPVSWTVGEFVLVHSFDKKHEYLARWALRVE
jgi:2'-5' RNA ligase